VIETLKCALAAANLNERHQTIAESYYWLRQYKLLAEKAIAELESQEPVAWLCTPNEDGLFGLPLSDKGCKDCFPVYRHPPQRKWVDLSDEDIEECFTITPDLYLKRHIAQRILDKFKEKNT